MRGRAMTMMARLPSIDGSASSPRVGDLKARSRASGSRAAGCSKGEPTMHLQIRATPAKSPASLVDFLEVLAREGINIEAAGGSNLEQGGEFAFAVAHDQECAAMTALATAGYRPTLVAVETCMMQNAPGALLACVARVTELNAASGRVIKDIAIGAPDANGLIPVQVYSEAG
jgi:hypothetical protein